MVFAPDSGRGSMVADLLPMHERFGDAVPAAQKPSTPPQTGARPELLALYRGTSLDTADRWTRGGSDTPTRWAPGRRRSGRRAMSRQEVIGAEEHAETRHVREALTPPTRGAFLGAGRGAVLALAWLLAEASPAFHKTITINASQVTGGPPTNSPFLSTTDPDLRMSAHGGRVTNPPPGGTSSSRPPRPAQTPRTVAATGDGHWRGGLFLSRCFPAWRSPHDDSRPTVFEIR
jgi:hypothetical protein